MPWPSPTGRSTSTTARRTGWRSPMATSSTRCCGPSSTTPSSTDRARSRSTSASIPVERILWTTISDDGRGLEESDRAWLFGRFERGAAGRTSGNGSGLGLYVSRALMRGMGGDLVLDDGRRRARRDVPPDPARRAGQRRLTERCRRAPRRPATRQTAAMRYGWATTRLRRAGVHRAGAQLADPTETKESRNDGLG